MTSRSNSDMWMGASSSDISMPSNALLDLEDDSPWKPPTSSQTNTLVESKDCLGASSFSKGVLEEEWYMAATPETSLMELPYSSPFTLPENRSTFNLLEPSLAFDNTSTLLNSFRTAPTLGLGLESNRMLDELACGGQSSFLTNISGSRGSYSNAGRSSPMAMSIENYNANLSSGLNISMLSSNGSSPISNIGSNSHSNFSIGLPSFSDAFASPTLSRGGLNKVTPNGAVPFHANKHPETSLGGSQTLFQKRAASRHNGGSGTLSPLNKSPPRILTSASNDSSVDMPETNNLPSLRKLDHNSGSDELNEMGLDGDEDDGKDDDDLDESGDGSGGAYEVEEGAGNGVGQFDGKGKGKKGLPAKNLMAERRRRKKLNDRLYMLRSVVPKITKMDRASILGDAIEYLKELLQRISDIHNELEEAKMEPSRLVPLSPSALNPRSNPTYQMVKEECPVLPNPESQPPRVEVRKREGQALNIHMFCARRPGLLLSTVRALDALGLDVQQAVISCFNGFALDLFRAEQAKDVDVGPEEIKAVLLLTAGCGN